MNSHRHSTIQPDIEQFKAPSVGDPRKKYVIELSEPEINAIHGAYWFVDGQIRAVERLPMPIELKRFIIDWWNTRGVVLRDLSKRLAVYDDGDAPYREPEE